MVNTVGKKISEDEKAYLAGLIDADGAIMALIENNKDLKFKFRVRIVVKVSMNNDKVINWIGQHFELGFIVKNRRSYEWIVKDQVSVWKILGLISKYLIGKADQLELALKILEYKPRSKEDFLKICKLADALSNLNIRSKNRRKNNAITVKEYFSRND